MLLTSADGALDGDAGTAGWSPVIATENPVGLLDYLSWAQGGRLVSVDSQLNTTSWSADHINDGDTASRWLSNKSNNTIEYNFDTDWDGYVGNGIPIIEIEILNYGNDDRSVKEFQIEVTTDGLVWYKLEVPGSSAGDEEYAFTRQSNGGLLGTVDSQLNTTSWKADNIHDGDANTRWLSNKSNNTLEFTFDPNNDGLSGAAGDTNDAFNSDAIYLKNYGSDDRSIREFQVEVKTLANPNWEKLKVPGATVGEEEYNFLLSANGGRLASADSQLNSTSWAAGNIHDGDVNSRWLSNKGNNALEFQFDVDGNNVVGEAADLFTIESIYLKNYGNDDRSIKEFQLEVKTASSPVWLKVPVAGTAANDADYNFVLIANGGSLTQVDSQLNSTSWGADNIHDGDQSSRWLSNKETNTLAFEFDVDFDGSAGDGINLDTIELINYGNDDRSIQTFEVDIQISGGVWQGVNAPGGGAVFTANMNSSGQSWVVGSFNNVTAVRIRTLSNYGDPSYTGASEIVFSGASLTPSYTFVAAMNGNGETFSIDMDQQPVDVTDVRLITINNHGDPSYTGAAEFKVLGNSVTENTTFIAAMNGNGETFQLDVNDIPVDVTAVKLITISNYGDPSYTGAAEFEVIGASITPATTFTLPMTTGPHRIVLDSDDQVSNVVGARVITISNHGDPSYTGLSEVRLLGDAIGPSYVFEAEMNASTQLFEFASAKANVFRIRTLTNHGDRSYTGLAEFVLNSSSCLPDPVAQWSMNEVSWSGTPGEVIDSSGNGNHGQAFNGATTVGGSCYYGEFDGTNDYLEIPHSDSLNGTDALTYMAWIRADVWTGVDQIISKSVHGGGSGRAQMGLFSESGQFKARVETVNGRYETSSSLPVTAGNWVHVASVFDGVSLRVYIDGAEQAARAFGATTLRQTTDPVNISKRVGSNQYYFDGLMDDVRIYTEALTVDNINQIISSAKLCALNGIDHFEIDTNGSTASTCLEKTITIRACENPSCSNLATNYAGAIDISVSTNHGDWSISDASGSLTAQGNDDGMASYVFDDSNDAGSIELDLANTHAETLSISVEDSALGVSTVSSNLVFGDNVFVLDNGDKLHIAGRNQPMTASLYTNDGANCAVNPLYAGNKVVQLWLDRDAADPSATAPQINSANLPDSASTSFNLNFVAGVAGFDFVTTDVGKYTLNLVDDGRLFSDQAIVGDTAIITRPFAFDLQVQGVASEVNAAADNDGGGVFMVAGRDFNVSVRAVAWDSIDDTNNDGIADGHDNTSPADNADLSDNAGVSSFGAEANGEAESVSVTAYEVAPDLLVSSNVLEDGGSPCAACVVSSFVSGQGTATGVYYANVGIIELQAALSDGSYLGGTTVVGVSGYVGRFIPDHFELQNPMISAADTSLTAYTYMGQPFLVDYELVAVNALNQTTDNYKDGYAKLNIADVGAIGDVGASVDVAYGAAELPSSELTSRLAIAGAAPLPDWLDGILSVIDLPLTLNKGAAIDGPFTAMALGISVEDSDGVTFNALDLDVDAANVGNDVMQIAGTPGELRYGRSFFPPVYGPEIPVGETLNIAFNNQYWNGSNFVVNIDDNTTVYEDWLASCVDADLTDGLLCSETSIVIPSLADPANVLVVLGEDDSSYPITITRPGVGNTGSLDIGFSVDNWLLFPWGGGADEAPVSRVSFGQYRGHDRIIYWREKTN
jgi:MSHA biogenesis protein MshQ